jgi:hypothetical protein
LDAPDGLETARTQFFNELDSMLALPLGFLFASILAPDSHASGPKSHSLPADFLLQVTPRVVEDFPAPHAIYLESAAELQITAHPIALAEGTPDKVYL